jgi:MOSC domain-containing protein YiiM
MPNTSPAPLGQVASLHLHPKISGEPLIDVKEIQAVEGKGILGEPRFFERKSRSGEPSRRNITLIEREQLDQHAAGFGIEISPGTIRSNIETIGVDLKALVNQTVQVGDATLFIYEPRTGCAKMDEIREGLREASGGGRLGVIAQVVKSGKIRVGDAISIRAPSERRA